MFQYSRLIDRLIQSMAVSVEFCSIVELMKYQNGSGTGVVNLFIKIEFL